MEHAVPVRGAAARRTARRTAPRRWCGARWRAHPRRRPSRRGTACPCAPRRPARGGDRRPGREALRELGACRRTAGDQPPTPQARATPARANRPYRHSSALGQSPDPGSRRLRRPGLLLAPGAAPHRSRSPHLAAARRLLRRRLPPAPPGQSPERPVAAHDSRPSRRARQPPQDALAAGAAQTPAPPAVPGSRPGRPRRRCRRAPAADVRCAARRSPATVAARQPSEDTLAARHSSTASDGWTRCSPSGAAGAGRVWFERALAELRRGARARRTWPCSCDASEPTHPGPCHRRATIREGGTTSGPDRGARERCGPAASARRPEPGRASTGTDAACGRHARPASELRRSAAQASGDRATRRTDGRSDPARGRADRRWWQAAHGRRSAGRHPDVGRRREARRARSPGRSRRPRGSAPRGRAAPRPPRRRWCGSAGRS